MSNQEQKIDMQNHLTLKHRVGYACGDAGGVTTLVLISAYLTRYLTTVLGIDFGTVGTLLLIWNTWDMINDPMVGGLMDRAFAKAKPGQDKFRPWILASIPVIVIGLIAFMTVPNMFSGIVQIVAVFLLKIVYEFGYTMMNIAMGSILSVMALNDTERTALSSARGIGSTVGGFIGMFTIPQILERLGETPQGYAAAGIFAAVAGGILVFFHYAWTEERNKAAQVVAEGEEEAKVEWSDILVTFKTNRAFLALAMHSVIIIVGQTLNSQTTAYLLGDVFHNPGAMSYGSTLQTVLQLVLLFGSPMLVKFFGNTVNMIRTYLVIGVVFLASLFVVNKAMELTGLVYVVWMYAGIALMIMSVQLQWGLVGQSIDYNEYLTGKRNEGTIYGFFSLTRRLGQVIAQTSVVWAIGAIGYSAEAAAADLPQAASTVNGLFAMNLVGPIVASVLSFLCFTFIWNIDNDLAAKISAFIANKNKPQA